MLEIFTNLTEYGVKFGVIVSFAVSYGLSVASWYVFERPILSLRRYFAYSGQEPGSTPTAADAPRAEGTTTETAQPA